MYPEEITSPMPIGGDTFFDQDEDSSERVALAAYLLLAGPLFVGAVRERSVEDGIVPPDEDLAQAGINPSIRSIADGGAVLQTEPLSEVGRASAQELAMLVAEANAAGDASTAARAVAMGLQSDDELIRVCALGSAVEFFNPATLDLPSQFDWFRRNARQDQTFQLLATLQARLGGPGPGLAVPGGRSSPPSPGISGLLAIHGTVLPTSQSNRPVWSVPGAPMFRHLKSLRGDIYDKDDYFRWEGGYTDYAREVAIWNLTNWLDDRGLSGIDVVAHSHGANVVMGSTMQGATFGKTVLLNCPVHWHKYRPAQSRIGPDVVSVRIKFDLVILMDRGAQRFPTGTIQEHVLPFWYTGHGAVTKVRTWRDESLDQYL